jgi:type I restriction enzyme S subunit
MQGWSKKRLIEITEKIGSGATPRGGKDAYKESGISLFRSLNVYDGIFKNKNLAFIDEDQASKLSNVIVREGDVLLNITGASIARCCVAPSELLPARVNQHVAIIRPRLDHINSNFLAYLLASKQYKDALLNTGEKAGATRQALTKAQLENFEVTIPKLSEQKRIVAILDEAFKGIDRAIAHTEKNLANARELFESYLNSKLLAITSSNPTQTLLCITDLIVDCEHKTAPTQETGIPSIRTPNIGKGYLIFDNVNCVSEETYELWTRRAKPEPGDLILAREAPAGNVGVIPEGQRVCLGQRTVLIRPKKEIANSQYLAFLLLHPIMQTRLLAHSTGATVQHVNMKDIRGLPISNLPPIQTQIVCLQELEQAKLQVNRLEAIYKQKIATLNELKQSILQKAFTGELTADTPKTVKEKIAA